MYGRGNPTLRGITQSLPTPRASRGASSTETVRLLPTPDAYEGERGGSQHPEKRRAGGHTPYLASVAEWVLFPTPSASVTNDGEDTETWLARRERVKATGVNGNGMGMPLTITVQLLGEFTNQRFDDGNTHSDE
ncbi:hypothetical protein GCM10022287_22340 [Gryllotalpicola koreensis]|uniref:Uncharacterized protein n=1 Tax=Gryllotalpicola koreensis TaxID=993086 RepID=A0ABP8A2E4_9MICO